jgi:hypothetical protein
MLRMVDSYPYLTEPFFIRSDYRSFELETLEVEFDGNCPQFLS